MPEIRHRLTPVVSFYALVSRAVSQKWAPPRTGVIPGAGLLANAVHENQQLRGQACSCNCTDASFSSCPDVIQGTSVACRSREETAPRMTGMRLEAGIITSFSVRHEITGLVETLSSPYTVWFHPAH
jgi:hypothetical protein